MNGFLQKGFRRNSRRILAFLLAVMMTATLIPVGFLKVNAQDENTASSGNAGIAAISTTSLTWADGSTVASPVKGTAYYFDMASDQTYATAGTYGLMTVASGSSNGLSYHSTTYGLAAKEGNNFTLQVPGNCYIVVSGDNNSSSGATITATSTSGAFETDTLGTKMSGHCDLDGCKEQGDNAVSFLYVGDAGTVTLTLNGSTAYICAMCIIPAEDDIVLSQYEQKSFSLSVNGTAVSVTSGENASSDSTVEVTGGTLELAAIDTAIVWANLSGAGTGTLTEDMLSDISDNVTASVSDNIITVTYKDTSTNPVSYTIQVKDNSASGTPSANGTPLTYDFRDGSILSALYDGNYKLSDGASVSSADGLVTLTGNNKIYYNGTTHGIVVNNGDSVSVKVAGDASVTFSLCQYSGSGSTLTVTGMAENGEISPAAADAQASTDGSEVTFTYTGDAATLVFTYTSGSSGYLHYMSVTNAAEASEAKEQTAMPEIKDYGTADSLTVTPVGQRLVLSQTGGKLATTNNAVDSSVSYYGFPATAAYNRLEADVVLNTCGSSNSYGIFFGAFDGTNIATLGIRNSTGLRGIYSKKSTDMAGAGIVDASITSGQKVHFTAEKTASGFVVTATPENGSTYTAAFSYNSSSYLLFSANGGDTEISYGFIVSNATATVTNMTYYDSEGAVLYDQNDCYEAVGTAPVVASVSAAAADTRDYITVSWSSSTEADGDGRYVVQVQKDGGDWTDVAETTDKSYEYSISEAGSYLFRVCGKLGVDGECNTGVTSEAVEVVAAMDAPEISISASASYVDLSWSEIDGAVSYEIYRYSYDEGAENVGLLTTTGLTAYRDEAVTEEVPYYYYIIARSESNYSNASETVWTVPTAGHTGDYVYEDEAVEIFLTKKSYDTVFENTVLLEGVVSADGGLEAYVNGAQAAEMTMTAGGSFSFTLTVQEGRNDVNLIFTDTDGNKTRQTYNYVYLTNYDLVADASYTGTDGELVNGIPTYSTVQAAVDSVLSDNTESKVILVMAGDYEERLVVNTPYISLIGEDRESTLIHYYPGVLGSTYEAGGDMANRCATYIQSGATGFTAENISFANDYVYSTADGKSNKSADAFRCDAEGAGFVNVKFVGVQDTLYMDKGHQYYYKCRIEGLVDFIYSGVNARAFFNDCEIVFVYESTKTSGYVCAPRTSADAEYGLIFYNCVITGEEGCSGSGYLLARPWGADAYITWINCYMGSVINKTSPYNDMSGNLYTEARFYEFGTYGPGFEINSDRRQISPSAAANLLSTGTLGWEPDTMIETLSDAYYTGSVVTDTDAKYVIAAYYSDSYLWTDGDDTGLGAYDMEGYAAAYGVSGGGLLKETSDNYYQVSTAEEFLNALLAVKSSGRKSVIEITADINLGCNEIEDFSSYSSIIKAYSAQPLTHPTLIETGVSVLSLTNVYNLTIFSLNGSSVKHANITMKNSENIIIRNIKFDELWEWDEATEGDYDRNDWDYMTIDENCNGIWIDHCTFYKAYDGVIDVKNPSPETDVTISWCEFLPGSEDNVFFNAMMDEMALNPTSYPVYSHMLESDMTAEQIWWYAYGQKKTHLFGQSDTATNAAGIMVTLANNYYFNSMDRMPRLRYGYAHVYNCIMDAQELLTAKETITNADMAKKIVSNGASSTCDAQILLENCYISGIQNALNSGNGSSPSGYISAVNSVYYMNGVETELEVKCNSTGDTRVLITDSDAFISALPYSDYTLYAAEELYTVVKPYAGAGKLELTVLQWEKSSYNDDDSSSVVPPAEEETDTPAEETPTEETPTEEASTEEASTEASTEQSTEASSNYRAEVGSISETVMTEDIKNTTGCDTVEELVEYLKAVITENAGAAAILDNIDIQDTYAVDISIMISTDNGITWVKATEDNFPSSGVDVVIPYPDGTNKKDYDFVIGHLITMGCNGMSVGTIEYFNPVKTNEGLKIHILSASPFVIGWKQIENDVSDDDYDDGGEAATVQQTDAAAEVGTEVITEASLTEETQETAPQETETVDTGDAAAESLPFLVIAVFIAGLTALTALWDKKRRDIR